MKIDFLKVAEKGTGMLILKRRDDFAVEVCLPNDYTDNYKIGQDVSIEVYQVSSSKYVLSLAPFFNKLTGGVELSFSNGYLVRYKPGYFLDYNGIKHVILDHIRHFEKGDNIKIKIK
jgi:ribosomal protein L21E